MVDCIFCKIADGRLKTDYVFEDDLCVVFKDIRPKAKTHLLIIPKEHIEKLSDMKKEDEGLVGHLFYVSRLLSEQLDLEGYRLQVNVGEAGGQEVFHLHIHLISNS